MNTDNDKLFAKDIMMKNVISVHPETPFFDATNIISENNFNGLPVVDKNNKLVGILTEYDFIVKGSMIHLPTIIKIFKDVKIFKQDKNLLGDNLKQIFSLKVKDVMNDDPMAVFTDTTIEEVARLFAEHHRVNPLPVLDDSKSLVGIISRYDIIKMYTNSVGVRDAWKTERERYVDKNVDNFLSGVRKEFVLVTKIRSRFWIVISILFVIVGFIIAMASILRININN